MTSWIYEKEYQDYLREHPEEKNENLDELPLGFKDKLTPEEKRTIITDEIRKTERKLIDSKIELLKSFDKEDWFPKNFKEILDNIYVCTLEIFLEKKIQRQKVYKLLEDIKEANQYLERLKEELIGNPFTSYSYDIDNIAEFIDCYYDVMEDITHMITTKKETY